MLSPRLLSYVRRESERAMPDRLQVIRMVSGGRDRGGYPLPATEEIVANTMCRLRGITAKEEVIASRYTETVTATVVCPLGTDVRASDTLRVDGVGYHIRGVLPRTEEHAVHTVCLVARASS